MPTKPHQ